jgi:hypothetical protein
LAKYDEIVKRLGRLRGKDFIQWFCPELNILEENISFEDREFEKVITTRRVDLLYLVKKENGEQFYFLLEFETGSYTDYEFRFLEYFVFVWRGVKLPIKPVVIFLNSTRTIQNNPTSLQCKIEEEQICDFRYTKVILPEKNWKWVLEKKLVALLPLLPISQIPKEEEEEALKETIEQIEKIPDEEQRAEIAGAFYLIGGYKYKKTIDKFIGEKLMEDLMESETYREAVELGEKKSIIRVLKARFKVEEVPSPIKGKLDFVKIIEDLDILVDKAALVETLEEFENDLNEIVKKQSN